MASVLMETRSVINLPIGLATKVNLINNVKEGDIISQKDVILEKNSNAYILRKEMENGIKELHGIG